MHFRRPIYSRLLDHGMLSKYFDTMILNVEIVAMLLCLFMITTSTRSHAILGDINNAAQSPALPSHGTASMSKFLELT